MYNNHHSFWSSIPVVTKNLLILNVLFFLTTDVLNRIIGFDLTNILGLHYFTTKSFNPAQLVTYMFMHGSFLHLFFNMFMLFMFGRFLEQAWNSKRFFAYYMITGIGAGLVQQVVWTIEYHDIISGVYSYVNIGTQTITAEAFLNKITTVGASGAVVAILLAFGMTYPNMPLYIMFIPIPIKAKYVVIGFAAVDLFMGVGNIQFANINIAHFAHLGGMLFGIILILIWRKRGKIHKY